MNEFLIKTNDPSSLPQSDKPRVIYDISNDEVLYQSSNLELTENYITWHRRPLSVSPGATIIFQASAKSGNVVFYNESGDVVQSGHTVPEGTFGIYRITAVNVDYNPIYYKQAPNQTIEIPVLTNYYWTTKSPDTESCPTTLDEMQIKGTPFSFSQELEFNTVATKFKKMCFIVPKDLNVNIVTLDGNEYLTDDFEEKPFDDNFKLYEQVNGVNSWTQNIIQINIDN